mmetsp:Transcript_9221/g.13660  ORF Transcript_9221/g.13660 Transcript_9221/m.13660 type:complete len:321 (+) Transcript_9221:2559-3521(+)
MPTHSITSTSTQMNLQDISKDYVIEQLKVLGFDEVPDYLVDEFLQELKSGNSTILDQHQQEQHNHINKRRNSNISISSTNTSRLDTSIASSYRTQQTFVDDADDSDTDSDKQEDETITAYTTFTQPSRLDATEIMSRRDHELQHSTVVDESLRDIPTHSLTIKSKKKHMPVDYTADYDKENNVIPLTKSSYEPPQRVKRRPTSARVSRPSSSSQQPTWRRSRPLSARGGSSSRPLSARSSSSLKRRSSTTSFRPTRPRKTGNRCRKHDPVARYAQMQKTWKKTGFLNKMKTGRKPLRLQVRKEMREISQNSEKYGYRHIY